MPNKQAGLDNVTILCVFIYFKSFKNYFLFVVVTLTKAKQYGIINTVHMDIIVKTGTNIVEVRQIDYKK